MEIVIQKVIEFWLYDMHVFSQWWLYAPLLIPAICYLSFFMAKWAVITLPVWLPFAILIEILVGKKTNNQNSTDGNKG